jgi:hypothetical protein
VAGTLALIDEIRAVRDEAGADLPLWLTEVGVTTSGPGAVSEAEQARRLVEICAAASREPGVAALYVHNLLELPGPYASAEPGFGLLRPGADGTLRAKPAFAALRRALAGPASCAAR